MLKPDLLYTRVTEITPESLRRLEIRALLLDVDNTLALHGNPEPFLGTQAWAAKMVQAGFSILILSNNTETRVAPFAAQYGLPFLSRACKPLPAGFLQAAKKLGIPSRQCAVVGDQVFTDLLGAKLSGMRAVLLEPIEKETGGLLSWKRRFERPFRKKYSTERSRDSND